MVNWDPSNFETKYSESLNEHTLVAENKNTLVPYEFWKASHLGPPGRLLFSRSLKIKYLRWYAEKIYK